jgi:hypothetical protein
MIKLVLVLLIAAFCSAGISNAATITCAAGNTSCVRDRIRQGCVLVNPPYLQNKKTYWRCPEIFGG